MGEIGGAKIDENANRSRSDGFPPRKSFGNGENDSLSETDIGVVVFFEVLIKKFV